MIRVRDSAKVRWEEVEEGVTGVALLEVAGAGPNQIVVVEMVVRLAEEKEEWEVEVMTDGVE
jgi:hypothetical protein